MANTIVKLDRPLVGHGTYHELEFREPTFADYVEVGEPYVWAPSGDSDFDVATPLWDRIGRYAERLLTKPSGEPLLLSQASVADARKIKDAIQVFFLASDPRVVASRMSQTTSSLNSDGAPPISAE